MQEVYIVVAVLIGIVLVEGLYILTRKPAPAIRSQVVGFLAMIGKEAIATQGTKVIVAHEVAKFIYSAIDEETDFFSTMLPKEQLEAVREALETIIDITDVEE